MNTKLILYPQNHNGQFNVLSSNPNELLVNGIVFNNLSSASSYDSATASFTTIVGAAPPTIPNTWFRFRTTVGATPALPTNSSGNAIFNSVSGSFRSGIYQRLTGLVVGQSYSINVNISGTGTGSFNIMALNGNNIIAGGNSSYLASNSVIVQTFIANATDNTILISYTNSIAANITVSHISVVGNGITPSGDIGNLSDGQVICDLYEDEDIPLTLSIDDFKNTAEQVQSYSKAFNLPATKRNNQIFENLFEVTRSSQNNITFNPYAKTQCALKQDGFILFEGYLRVIDIQDKDGEISYNVNLYSEVIALVDLLGDKTFSLLDFEELNHAYNITNIKNSWNDTGTGITFINASSSDFRDPNDTVKYPFCDWFHNYTVDSSGNPELPNLESTFRPFIQIKYVIDRIFQDTDNFTYSSNFFDTTDFKKLYMDFSWGESRQPMVFNNTGALTLLSDFTFTTAFQTVTFDELDTIPPTLNTGTELNDNFGYSSGVFTAVANNQVYNVNCQLTIQRATLVTNAPFQVEWVHSYSGGQDIYGQLIGSGVTTSYVANFSVTLQAGDTLFFRGKNTTAIPAIAEVDSGLAGFGYDDLVRVTTNANETTNDTLLQTLRGELQQWQFLKGIMTMFNLVSMPDPVNPNNIIIEPYKDVFLPSLDTGSSNFFDNNSNELDWTYKVDISQIKLSPLTDLSKKTIFKFVEDDDDYMFQNYKNAVNGFLYGSQLFDATTTTGGLQSVLTGDKEIIAEPFAATVPKPLMSQFPEFITPAIYSYNANDGTSEGFDNSPRIMYNNGKKTLTSCTYKIPEQNGVAEVSAETEFLQFSHLSAIPTLVSSPPVASDTQDFHFGICQLIGLGNPTPNNLFNTYWLPYFNELYNADSRTMSIKVNLTAGDINTFRFYDTVFIKNRSYRVNKIDYKPNDLATVEFILIT